MVRLKSLGLVVAASLAPMAAAAEGPEIDHKPVGCIVVGKFPKMNACFRPAGDLARARVYFRPEGVESWYYVDMASDAPCHASALPKPGKTLVGKKIEYYIEAQDKQFASGRTAEFGPIVVRDEAECRKDVPVAPISAAGPTAVFPAVPVGMATSGAISATTAAIAVAGAGAATAGVAVAASGDDGTTTTTPVAGGATTTTATTVPTTGTTTVPTTVPTGNRPPVGVFQVNPNPPTGRGPLSVNFSMCRSTDPDNDPLVFSFDFGDGSRPAPPGPACSADRVYSGPSPVRAGVSAALPREYNASTCVSDNRVELCRNFRVNVLGLCDVDRGDPEIDITSPSDGAGLSGANGIDAAARAVDDQGVGSVEFTLLKDASSYCDGSGPYVEVGRATDGSFPYGARLSLPSGFCFTDRFKLRAVATDLCGKTATSEISFTNSNYYYAFSSRSAAARRLAWLTELDVAGAQGHIVINGVAASVATRGRSFGMARPQKGTNRVEAVLVDATGAGTWRFELVGRELVKPGTLRVVAGDVALVTETTVVFRMRGTPGERVVFTFDAN